MEFLTTCRQISVAAVLFDFDGTISTLRYGWEDIMEPLMLEMIAGKHEITDGMRREVQKYIDESTGIQTIHQMKWLVKTIKRYGLNPDMPDDPWWYKAEYNRRLMDGVLKRRQAVANGEKNPEDYLIKGSAGFLDKLKKHGVRIYVASGTDHADVIDEAKALGVFGFFDKISGAMPGSEDCSKEAVLRDLIVNSHLSGDRMVVIGDGKVEIALGREIGARTLGLATNEEKRCGVNPVKRVRLLKAGADAVAGDFTENSTILRWLGLA